MLAYAIAADEDALISDYAEYYGIYDYEQLPVGRAAALAFNLPLQSRTMRRLTGVNYSITDYLLASICDRIDWMMYAQAGGRRKGIPEPVSMVSTMTGSQKAEKKKRGDVTGFADPDAFEKRRQQIMKGGA